MIYKFCQPHLNVMYSYSYIQYIYTVYITYIYLHYIYLYYSNI